MAFLSLFSITAGFSLVTPHFGGADEPEHFYYMHAVATQDWPLESSQITLPHWAVSADPACWAFDPNQSATCASPTQASDITPVTRESKATNYPPLYYLLVGWPLKFVAGPWALRWVRLVSSLLFSLLAAFGVAFLQGEKTPWGGPLALATITPTTLAFAGLVQPQSLEVGASIALAGLVMPLAVYKDEIRLRLLLGIPVAGLLILSRTTGPWWALTICLLALAIYPRSFFPAFFRSPSLWRFVGCAAFFCIVSLGWGFATNDWYEFHSVRATEGACGIFACILPQGTNWVRLVEATAIAGWLNPVGALHRLYLYWAFLAVLFLSACLSQPLKAFLGLAFAAAAYVLSVVLLSVSWVDAYGAPIWQGRYALPLFTGLFIALATISGTGIESGRRLPRALPQWVGRFGAAAQGILILDLALVAAVRFWIGLSQGYYSLLLAADTPLASRVGLIAVFAGVAGLAFIEWHRPRPQSAGIEEQPTQTTTPDSTDQTS